jgi:hypothetical protein
LLYKRIANNKHHKQCINSLSALRKAHNLFAIHCRQSTAANSKLPTAEAHSYLNASTGLSFDALRAGSTPLIVPTRKENSSTQRITGS